MTTTDTTALQERVAEELYYEQYPEGRHRDEWPAVVHPDAVYEYRDLAAAVLPIIAAEVQAASEKAWDDGESSGLTEAGGGYGWPNPYRATETGDRA